MGRQRDGGSSVDPYIAAPRVVTNCCISFPQGLVRNAGSQVLSQTG